MIAAGESEDNIALVIKSYKPSTPTKAPPTTGNTSHVPGKDLTVGDAMLGGAKGWLKGATLDLPESIISGVSALFNPIDTIKSIPEGLSSMWDTAMQAGHNPEAFGRMSGNIGGQGLVTGGLAKGVPPTLRGVGGVMKRHQPLSGMIPRLAEPRILRNMERGIGSGIERLGTPKVIKPEPIMPNFRTSGLPDIDVSGFDDYSMPPEIAPKFARPDSNISGMPVELQNPGTYSVPPVRQGLNRPVSNQSGMPQNVPNPGTYSMPAEVVKSPPKTTPKPVDVMKQKAIDILTAKGLEITPTNIKLVIRTLKAAMAKK